MTSMLITTTCLTVKCGRIGKVTAVKGSLQLGINHPLTTRSCRGMIIGEMSFLVTPTAKGLALARTTALTAMNLLGAEYLTATSIVKGLAVTGMNALATTTPQRQGYRED
ncbi:unnamed protein product, partial [Aureobasidium pullulans]